MEIIADKKSENMLKKKIIHIRWCRVFLIDNLVNSMVSE